MRRTTEALMDRLSGLVDERGGDWSLRLEVGLRFAWLAEVRVTEFPNVSEAPDRSVVFFQAGGEAAEDASESVLKAALAEVLTWDPDRPQPATWQDEGGRSRHHHAS